MTNAGTRAPHVTVPVPDPGGPATRFARPYHRQRPRYPPPSSPLHLAPRARKRGAHAAAARCQPTRAHLSQRPINHTALTFINEQGQLNTPSELAGRGTDQFRVWGAHECFQEWGAPREGSHSTKETLRSEKACCIAHEREQQRALGACWVIHLCTLRSWQAHSRAPLSPGRWGRPE